MSRYRLPEDHGDPYVPDEDDPDYRFSEAHGYADWDPPRRRWAKALVVGIALLLLAALLLPVVLQVSRSR